MHIDLAGATHVGYVRDRNEDAYLTDPVRRLLVVADGLGGHPAGDVASRIAIDTIDRCLVSPDDHDPADGRICATICESIDAAHAAIHERAEAEPALAGMGTTLVVAHLGVDDWCGHLAHVGDSRAYRIRGAEPKQVTADHSAHGPWGSGVMTQAVGTLAPIEVEASEVPLERGDTLLLCTDGLTDMLDDDTIAATIGDAANAEGACTALVDAALTAGGVDNVTVALAQMS